MYNLSILIIFSQMELNTKYDLHVKKKYIENIKTVARPS
jgi:hypothetical protein